MSTITAPTAHNQVTNWLADRDNLPLISQLFNSGNYFLMQHDFDHTKFINHQGHAYFAIEYVINSGVLELKLSLIFISDVEDSVFDENNLGLYLYQAPYITTPPNTNAPTGTQLPADADVVEDPHEMRSRWNTEGIAWITDRINHSEDGLTIVSVVPMEDITSHFAVHDQLEVYLGLRGPLVVDPALKLALLFYDRNTGTFLNTAAADFTTPKPPFGTDKEKKYKMLTSFFSQ